MSMSFGKSRMGLLLGTTLALLAVGPRPTIMEVEPRAAVPIRTRGKGKGRSARGSRMGATGKMISQNSCYAPHQGMREIARRKVQMLRIELNRCCKQMAGMPYDAQIDYGYADGAQDLDDQILELMPLAYGRKTHNAPRRVWRIECFNSSRHRASSRAPLKRNFYVRYFGYPIVLQVGGAA